MSQSRVKQPFFTVLIAYSVILGFGVFGVLGILLATWSEVQAWHGYFLSMPERVEFSVNVLYGLVLIPAMAFFPIAFFPEHWSSEKSSAKRVRVFVLVLIVTLLINLYVRLFSEGHLQGYLLPEGYVQCETEPKGTKIMFKEYVFVKDSKLCEYGLKP